MKLGQPETFRMFYQHERRVGNIHSHLDDRRADQHLCFSLSETLHRSLFLRRRDPAVQQLAAERVHSLFPLFELRQPPL